MTALIIISCFVVAGFAVLALVAFGIGRSQLAARLAREGEVWLLAVRGGSGPHWAPGVRRVWGGPVRLAFLGADQPWWDRVEIVAGATGANSLVSDGAAEDVCLMRLRTRKLPVPALGLLVLLTRSGILSAPPETPNTVFDGLGYRAGIMPSEASISALLAQPDSFAPDMLNFLSYSDAEGAAAYARYGQVALRSVYRTGGALVLYARITETVIAPRGGPTAGRWDEIAIMHYPSPPAILTMEHLPDYRAALEDRSRGLERNIVLAVARET